MAPAQPVLVIVSGPPAAGKTSLTESLRDELRLPLLSRDAVKEALMEVEEPGTVEETDRLSRAAERVLVAVGSALLQAGAGVILEAPFHVDRGRSDLAPLAACGRAVVVHCEAREGVLIERFRERAASGRRDPGHMDRERAPALRRKLEVGEFEPPDLRVPVLRVDTSERYEPSLAEVTAWIREQASYLS